MKEILAKDAFKRRSDEWTTWGNHCCVVVRKHTRSSCFGEGDENCWCVYGIVYKKHPIFERLNIDLCYYQCPEIGKMPLRGGCTYFQKIKTWRDGEECVSYKIGCDYSHLHDDRFAKMKTKDGAREVFDDALYLLNYLNNHERFTIKENSK